MKNTKKCNRCNLVKSIDDFFLRNKHRGIRHNQCKECYRDLRDYIGHYTTYNSEYKTRAKARKVELQRTNTILLIQYLKHHPCKNCGETDPIVLEFDHKDPSKKEKNISYMLNNHIWSTILKEIDKCDVLCANCHRRKTAKQFNHLKYTLCSCPTGEGVGLQNQ